MNSTDGSNAFAYAGQPASVSISALNAQGALTQNYDGSAPAAADRVANDVTVSAVSGLTSGAMSGSLVSATAFDTGVGTGTVTDTYAAAKKLSAPERVGLNATDADVTSNSSTPTLLVRSGRIKLSNAYGSEQSTISMPIQVQYWDGRTWVPSADAACTPLSTLKGAVVRSVFKSHKGVVLNQVALPVSLKDLALDKGVGTISLNPPGKGVTGTVDVTLDLSASGANMPWFQSLDASCGANTVCNPTARASFGVFAPETQKTVNTRNVY